MPKILTLCLSAYWLAAFIAGAVARLPDAGAPLTASVTLAAFCHMLAATLFLNTAVVAWNNDGEKLVASIRTAAAIALVALLVDGLLVSPGTFAAGSASFQVAALGVSYLVIAAEATRVEVAAQKTDRSGELARDFARTAGHRTMLSRYSTRDAARTEG